MTLATHEIEDIVAIGKDAVACETLGDLQNRSLHRIQGSVGAESSIYFDVKESNNQQRFVNNLSYGVPVEGPKAWCEHYKDHDPFVEKLMRNIHKGESNTVISSDVIRHNSYVNSEFYYDFLRPQSIYHVMVVAMVKDRKPIGMIGLHRPRCAGAFSETEVYKANMLAPFFSAAIEKVKLNERVRHNRAAIDVLASELPNKDVMILDQDLRPIFINGHICELLDVPVRGGQNSDSLRPYLPVEILTCCDQWKALSGSGGQSPLLEKIDFKVFKSGSPLSGDVRICKSISNDKIFIINLNSNEQKLINDQNCEKYGLTHREKDIVMLVSTGMTNPEIAQRLYISVRTVQNHLRSIYAKVNVHNRTSLVSRLV